MNMIKTISTPGSGGAADDSIGTVSTTGFGDAILRYNVAQRILLGMESGKISSISTLLILISSSTVIYFLS